MLSKEKLLTHLDNAISTAQKMSSHGMSKVVSNIREIVDKTLEQQPIRQMHLCQCIFKRREDSTWESGLAFLANPGVADAKLILAADLSKVTELWNYKLCPNLFAATVNIEMG